jgi:hypothetical protein
MTPPSLLLLILDVFYFTLMDSYTSIHLYFPNLSLMNTGYPELYYCYFLFSSKAYMNPNNSLNVYLFYISTWP